MISSRPTVTKLDLSHNALRDDGCMVLFKFLCSDPSRKNRISEIKLGKNGIGDRGLLAISDFLYGNETLIDLYLPAVCVISRSYVLPFSLYHSERIPKYTFSNLGLHRSIKYFPPREAQSLLE